MTKIDRKIYNKTYYETNKETILVQKRSYHEANKAIILAKKKAYHEANRERLKAKSKAYHKANRDNLLAKRRTFIHRCYLYGVSPEFIIQTYYKQLGCCLFCPFKFPPLPIDYTETCPKEICFDHNHVSNKFRGLLCNNCNRDLGHIEKFLSTNKLEAAVKYINDHR